MDLLRLALTLLPLAFLATAARAETADEQIARARAALKAGKPAEAEAAAREAVRLEPQNPHGHFLLGESLAARREHEKALAAYREVLKLDPSFDLAHDRAGGELFKLGRIEECIRAFEKFLKLRPDAYPSHWRYGIACYYAGRYEDGAKQFKAGEAVFGDDVENAFWHFLCNARAHGVEKARAALLKVGPDRRIPMMEIYAMVGGKSTPEKVLARAADPELPEAGKRERMFYAHLYIALYYEAHGDKEKTLEHMKKADELKIGHYMWDVAHVHLQKMTAGGGKKE